MVGVDEPGSSLTCAVEYLQTRDSDISDVTLWSWTTSEAARILNLDGELGGLSADAADISVFSYSETPYRVVVEADPKDTRLVLRDGEALYGTPAMVEQAWPPSPSGARTSAPVASPGASVPKRAPAVTTPRRRPTSRRS